MSKNTLIFIIIIVLGFSFIFLKKSDKEPKISEIRIFPESTITHGHGLAVDIANSNNLYIATHHGLLLLKNQKDLYRLGTNKDDYMGFTPHPTDTSIFYSSGHPESGGNLGFQISHDGGYNWHKISDGLNGPVDFHAMTISPVNLNLIYGWYRGNLQRSEDGGKQWKIVNKGLLAVQLTADPKDENVIYASTPNGQGVQVSKNKGESWQSLSPLLEDGQVSVLAINPTNNQELLVFSEKLGGLNRSLDGGRTWIKSSEPFNKETLLYIAYDKRLPSTIYALTHENAIYQSLDGFLTWKKIR